jgi:nitroreductase
MQRNEVLEVLMNRKSVRKYRKDLPDRELIETIVRAGQQAPFASQLYSVILSTKGRLTWGAPLCFTICVDFHKLGLFMAKRGWEIKTNKLSLLLLGLQDASYMAENMVIAAESLGLGSCFLGEGSLNAKRVRHLVAKLKLPKLVLPMVELVMGYPDESEAVRPRYPLAFTLFDEEYPELDEAGLAAAMEEMDRGYLAQDYYGRARNKIPLEDGRAETFSFADYSWTEHISRKWGQWAESPDELLDLLAELGLGLDRKGGAGGSLP